MARETRDKMKQGKAVIIKANGAKEVVTFTIGESYKVLSNAVEGMIECVRLAEDTDMWCNENGIAEGRDLNLMASAIYNETFGVANPILGNVIITGGADEEGETLGLTEEQVQKWLAYNKAIIPTAYFADPMYAEYLNR